MNDEKLQKIDIAVIIVSFIIGCILGKIILNIVGINWFAFNLPVLIVLGVAETIWSLLKKNIMRDNK